MTQDGQTDELWLSTLRRYHPQLTEKAVIDLVNGLEVVGDHLRCRSTPQSILNRIWHGVTGRTLREQYVIDVNLKTGLEVVTAWLQDLQAFQMESDLALTVVAEKLDETRTMIGSDNTRLEIVFKETLGQVNIRLDELKRQVNELVARDKAKDQIELLLYRWEESIGRGLPPLVQMFLVIDKLWWGHFGCYCRLARDTEAVAQIIELARWKIAQRLADRLALSAHDIIAVETLLSPIAKVDDAQKEVVFYLADRGAPHHVPLLQAIARATHGDTNLVVKLPNLPRAFSLLGLSSRLFHESRRATMEVAS